jgi:predicted P-loop ATPase
VSHLKDYPGLEFKDRWIQAAGSYIEQIDGVSVQKPYKILFNSPSSCIDVPNILLARIKYEKKTIALAGPVREDSATDMYRFIDLCKNTQAAVEGQSGDVKTYSLACTGRDFGLSEATVLEIMAVHFNPRCDPPWSDEDLAKKVHNAFEYSDRPAGVRSTQNDFPEPSEPQEDVKVEKVRVRYAYTKDGSLQKILSNLVQFMKYPVVVKRDEVKRSFEIPSIGHSLRYDQFSHRIVWTNPAPWVKQGNEWDDDDAIIFKGILSEQLHLDFPTNMIHEGAVICAKEKAFHPVRDYLTGLKWDGVPRLDTWLIRYCGALDNEYTRFVGRKVLIAAVARVFRPGCKFDHVIVLEGEQGQGKSWMWEHLAAPWFTDAPLNIQDKGAVEVMQGKWVVELGEMEALSKYESRTIKGFLTRTEDRCRMAYERMARSYPRQCIFVGSINPEQSGWLKDTTGNRRYWPVPITGVDLPGIKEARGQLWAEALINFEKGEKIHVESAHMRQFMRDMVDSRMHEDPWFGQVEEYLHTHAEEFIKDNSNKMTVMPVLLYNQAIGGTPATFDMRAAGRMMSILKSLGFEKQKTFGKLGYVYVKEIVREL